MENHPTVATPHSFLKILCRSFFFVSEFAPTGNCILYFHALQIKVTGTLSQSLPLSSPIQKQSICSHSPLLLRKLRS